MYYLVSIIGLLHCILLLLIVFKFLKTYSLDTLREATSTPCNHLYCRVCIETAAKNEDFKCPLCNKAIHTDHLRPAFDIQEIVKEFLIMRDDFEQQNEMNLSQVPVTRFLSHGDSLEEESSPRIPGKSGEVEGKIFRDILT